MLCDKVLDFIFASYFMVMAITSLWILFHAIFLNKLFLHFVFYRWRTSFLLCSDARADLI